MWGKECLLVDGRSVERLIDLEYICGSIFAVEALTLPTAVYSQPMASTVRF